MKEQWNRYYAEYIREHKSDGKDLIQLTNETIGYCMKKTGVKKVNTEKESGKEHNDGM